MFERSGTYLLPLYFTSFSLWWYDLTKSSFYRSFSSRSMVAGVVTVAVSKIFSTWGGGEKKFCNVWLLSGCHCLPTDAESTLLPTPSISTSSSLFSVVVSCIIKLNLSFRIFFPLLREKRPGTEFFFGLNEPIH